MQLSRHRIAQALQALAGGGVIACPTESVWGLSCDPARRVAVERLLQLKQRPMAKGLILVASAMAQLDFLLDLLDAQQKQQLSQTWPGPNTWLLPHGDRLPAWICGEHDTVAVRVSAHPLVAALCDAWGGPLVSTSANPAGAQPARAGFQVRRYFGSALDAVLPGAVGGNPRPSVIRDLRSGQVVRN